MANESEGVVKFNERSKHYPKFFEEIPSQDGKVFVITGTTSGTGKIAAKTLLLKGGTVVTLNRNTEKARKSLEEFFKDNESCAERTRFVKCDLQNFESVREAAEEVSQMFEASGIDVLVNNAGIMAAEDKATVDGYDIQMQTNHLSHFLLTKLLYPLLNKRAEEVGEARVVNHSSFYRLIPFDFLKARYFRKNGGNLGGNSSGYWSGARYKRYHQSKLANSVFTSELQRRLKKAKSKVVSFCAHPGVADTELFVATQESGGMKSKPKGQSAEDGTLGLLTGILKQGLKKGGIYGPKWTAGKPVHLKHGMFNTAKGGKRLWRESEAACGEFKV